MHEKITIILKNKKKYITITKNSNRKQTKKLKNKKTTKKILWWPSP